MLAQSRKLNVNTRQPLWGQLNPAFREHSNAAVGPSCIQLFTSQPARVTSNRNLRYQAYLKLLIDKTFKDNDQDKLIAGMEKACHLMAFCYLQAVFKLLNRWSLGFSSFYFPWTNWEATTNQTLFSSVATQEPCLTPNRLISGFSPQHAVPQKSCSGDTNLHIPWLLFCTHKFGFALSSSQLLKSPAESFWLDTRLLTLF